jgi:hypothetical protein
MRGNFLAIGHNKQALRRQWFAGVKGGVNQGLLPMTINEEESNLFCACHFLNCDGRPRAIINHRLLVQSKWCKTENKEKSEPSRVSNPGH